MRIGIAALHHETNSFSNIPMDWEYLRRTRFEKETYRDVYAYLMLLNRYWLEKKRKTEL